MELALAAAAGLGLSAQARNAQQAKPPARAALGGFEKADAARASRAAAGVAAR